MKNSCEASSQNLVHSTSLVPMLKFVLEKPVVNGSNRQKREKWLPRSAILFSCRLLTTNLTKNDTPPWVILIHFAIEKYCPCFQIPRSIAQYGFWN